MKKKVAVLGAVLTVALLSAPAVQLRGVQQASFTYLRPVTYTQQVVVAGEVAQKEGESYSLDYPVVAKDVLVKEGQWVEAGQTIATVDAQKTAKLIQETYSSQALQVLGGQSKLGTSALPQTIQAQKSGYIGSVSIKKNQSTAPQDELYTLSEGGALLVKVSIPESEIEKVAVGQQAQVTCSAFSDKSMSATVTDVAKFAKKETRGTSQSTVVEAELALEGAGSEIMPGLTASVSIQCDDPQQMSALPQSFIGQDERGEFLYILQDACKVKKHYITTGRQTGEWVEVLDSTLTGQPILSQQQVKEGSTCLLREGAVR
ncbi:HlyD family efflux transporter periplasmic adaptor subunit [Neobittarella massiliensis]|uniref:HlyD family efflux transporter periplasmic adaptor subunit n=1 Tax=Neobittarella massiliensis (ex Bilen et al. 2018) TaxID=2041842 RepID=A0A8J6IPU1_9FIRM|nr:HlyD family efflux transporter periplasmic adaptor subunit [Neobittarella massiliensis]MBC3515783.1 HlyD family efflux transporter periplasmic adaptor subunit [Neobittarella massiliensis]